MALSASRALWTIITSGVTVIVMAIMVIMMVMTIVVMIVIVVTSIFAMSGAGSLFGFFGASISIRCLYQLADGGGPLAIQLARKLLVSEPFGEGSDGLGISNVGDGVSYLQEAPDEVA